MQITDILHSLICVMLILEDRGIVSKKKNKTKVSIYAEISWEYLCQISCWLELENWDSVHQSCIVTQKQKLQKRQNNI